MITALLAMALETADRAPSLAEISRNRRLVILSAPSRRDPALIEQERSLGVWRRGADQRDVTVLEVIGGRQRDFADDPMPVMRRYHLAADRFGMVLIGKDGNVALRSAKPVSGARLQAAIDAMPMRRAGQR